MRGVKRGIAAIAGVAFAALALAGVMVGGVDPGGDDRAPQQPPDVVIVKPEKEGSLPAPARLDVLVEAEDANGDLTTIELFNGTTLLATSDKSPLTWTGTDLGVQVMQLRARATDATDSAS